NRLLFETEPGTGRGKMLQVSPSAPGIDIHHTVFFVHPPPGYGPGPLIHMYMTKNTKIHSAAFIKRYKVTDLLGTVSGQFFIGIPVVIFFGSIGRMMMYDNLPQCPGVV